MSTENIPDKKETHTVTFSHYLENDSKFIYSIYADLQYVNRAAYSMIFTHLDSTHCLLIVKEQGTGIF